MHKTDKAEDYRAGFYTCTATRALDDFQTAWHKGGGGSLPRAARTQASEDKRRREQGYHPDRARDWFTYTAAEGWPD